MNTKNHSCKSKRKMVDSVRSQNTKNANNDTLLASGNKQTKYDPTVSNRPSTGKWHETRKPSCKVDH